MGCLHKVPSHPIHEKQQRMIQLQEAHAWDGQM